MKYLIKIIILIKDINNKNFYNSFYKNQINNKYKKKS